MSERLSRWTLFFSLKKKKVALLFKVCFLTFSFVETRSHCVAHAALKLLILLPQPWSLWACGCTTLRGFRVPILQPLTGLPHEFSSVQKGSDWSYCWICGKILWAKIHSCHCFSMQVETEKGADRSEGIWALPFSSYCRDQWLTG